MFSILVWEKPVSIINKNRYSQNIEYIIRIYDYGTALNKVSQNEFYNRVQHVSPVSTKHHPTEKPVALIERIVELNTKEGDVVCDPFIGSGSTAIAAIRRNRKYIGFEVNKEYYDVAMNRIRLEKSQLRLF